MFFVFLKSLLILAGMKSRNSVNIFALSLLIFGTPVLIVLLEMYWKYVGIYFICAALVLFLLSFIIFLVDYIRRPDPTPEEIERVEKENLRKRAMERELPYYYVGPMKFWRRR